MKRLLFVLLCLLAVCCITYAQSVSSYEYWIDSNHGQHVEGSVNGQTVTLSVPISGLSAGVHFFNYRTISSNGDYGMLYRTLFYLPDLPVIAAYEYWIDDDTDNAVTGSDAQSVYTLSIDVSSLTAGDHTFNFRVKNSEGYWSDVQTESFTIDDADVAVYITMPTSGIRTYSNAHALDFTNVTGIKAYVASEFTPNEGEIALTRVYNVPEGEGLLLKGEGGEHEVPFMETDKVYSNLLKGVPTATTVAPTDGDYTNFILANGSHGMGFYTLASAGEIAAGKAYLQLKTSDISTMAREVVKLVFDDETTSISSMDNGQGTIDNKFYDLQGRRVINPVKGLYIVNGKKVSIK